MEEDLLFEDDLKILKIEYLRYSSMRVLCHLCGVSYLYCLPSPVLSGRSPVVLSPVSSVLLTSTLVLSPLCCIPPTYVSRLSSGVSCPSTIYYESCGDLRAADGVGPSAL